MQSKAKTVEEYLAELPEDRRAAIGALRKVILKNLDKGIVEGMSYGMITYCIPHSVYPPGYHCNPAQALPYTAIASQKNYMSFYFDQFIGEGKTSAENAEWFRAEWAKTGKKLDMGKVCIRFKKIEDLPLELIGRLIKRVPVKTFIQYYEGTLGPDKTSAMTRKTRTGTAPAKQAATKKPAAKRK